MKNQYKLVVFQNKNIRRTWYKEEWFYSLMDIVAVLSDGKNPTDYLKKIRKRDEELKTYLGTNCPQVEMQTKSFGPKYQNEINSSEELKKNLQKIFSGSYKL